MSESERLLNSLSDPKKFNEDIDIQDIDIGLLRHFLERMLLIRLVEERLALEKEAGKIGGPVHLGAGQEAIAVGISENLSSYDRVFGAHRSHSHVLALEPCVRELFAEVLGKDTGMSKGMGGSMHLSNVDVGFIGSVPIVAGTVPLAVGASFDAMYRKKDGIGVAYIGDGAVEEGVVHESLNLAKVLNTPTLFVVENNLFASHMDIDLRQPRKSTSRFAEANDIEAVICDGNNVVEVYTIAREMIGKIREGDGPKFIEAVTYRHFGHVDYRRDIDVGVNRSKEDLENWLERDPIPRLINSLTMKNIMSKEDFENIRSKTLKEIQDSWDLAINDPYPSEDAIFSRVFHD